jgi:ankyrin repeat protein
VDGVLHNVDLPHCVDDSKLALILTGAVQGGRTPLILATMRDDFSVVKLLVNNGADATIRDNVSGQTSKAVVIQIKLTIESLPQFGKTAIEYAKEDTEDGTAIRMLLNPGGSAEVRYPGTQRDACAYYLRAFG